MNIQIIEAHAEHTQSGRYFVADMDSGKHAISVMFSPDRVYVIVKNASHRAWRGGGKYFGNAAEAVAAYKTGEIRAMIELAAQLNAEQAA